MTIPKCPFSAQELSPCDNYRPVTIFWPCPEVVTISDKYCTCFFKYLYILPQSAHESRCAFFGNPFYFSELMTAVAEIAASSALNVDPLIRISDTAAALPFSPYSSCFGEWIQPKEGTIERHDYSGFHQGVDSH